MALYSSDAAVRNRTMSVTSALASAVVGGTVPRLAIALSPTTPACLPQAASSAVEMAPMPPIRKISRRLKFELAVMISLPR